MPPNSSSAGVVARRLLQASTAPAGVGNTLPDPVSGVQGLFRTLSRELARWFGPFGYHALLTRALAEARRQHPALAAVALTPSIEVSLDGLPEAARLHGAEATIEGVATLLTTLIDLLGRLIGEDLALRLMSHAVLDPALDVGLDVASANPPGGAAA